MHFEIRPAGQPDEQPAISKPTEAGKTLALQINNAPMWYRKYLQRRGIFIGDETPTVLVVFKGHDGRWIDVQTFEPLDIEEINT